MSKSKNSPAVADWDDGDQPDALLAAEQLKRDAQPPRQQPKPAPTPASPKHTRSARTRFLDSVRQDRKVTPLVAAARNALSAYRTHLEDNDSLLSPIDGVARLQAIIGKAKNAAEISAAQAEIAKLTGPGIDEASRRARALAFHAYEPVREALRGLLLEAEGVAIGILHEAILAETELFDKFGMETEPTAISRLAQSILEEIRRMRDGVNAPIMSLLPSGNSGVLNWFTAA